MLSVSSLLSTMSIMKVPSNSSVRVMRCTKLTLKKFDVFEKKKHRMIRAILGILNMVVMPRKMVKTIPIIIPSGLKCWVHHSRNQYMTTDILRI